MNYSAMEYDFELECQFPFQDEEELPFKNDKKDVPITTKKAPEYDSDDEDVKFSNAFKQVLDINRETAYSAMEYEAELKKRGAPFKYCLVNCYLRKFPFEDKDDVPSSEYYTSDDDENVRRPYAHEIVKRFLKQVRESNGYDVDCIPPRFWSPFIPKDPYSENKSIRDDVMGATHFAIEKINSETGETYELVQVDKVVFTGNTLWVLLTFTVKKAGTDDDSFLKTIRAMVYEPRCKSDDYMLEEWMFKPPATDISKGYMDPKKKKAKIGESKGNVVGLSGVETSVLEHIFCALDKRSAISLSRTCKSCWSTWVSLKKSSTQIHNLSVHCSNSNWPGGLVAANCL